MPREVYHTVICSPLEFNELAVEIFLNETFIARVNQENTIEKATLEIFSKADPLICNYHNFSIALRTAFNQLKFFQSEGHHQDKFSKKSVFPTSNGTAEDSNRLGLQLAEQILRDPKAYILPDGRGGKDVYNSIGQGLRLDEKKQFVCFLEPRQLIDLEQQKS
jgi:hypothetical protein